MSKNENNTGKVLLGLSLLGIAIVAFKPDKPKLEIISKNSATKQIVFKVGSQRFDYVVNGDNARFGPEHPSPLLRAILNPKFDSKFNVIGGSFILYQNNKRIGEEIEFYF